MRTFVCSVAVALVLAFTTCTTTEDLSELTEGTAREALTELAAADSIYLALRDAGATEVIREMLRGRPEIVLDAVDVPSLVRYALTFAPGHEYKLAATVQAGGGVHTSRPAGVATAWGNLPASVKPACGPTEYYLVMTTTEAASGPYKIALEVTQGDSIGCDTCLIGTWDIDIPSFTEYSEAPFQETPGLFQFDAAGGLWRYRFRADGTMKGEFDFFYTYSLHQEGGELGADIVTNGEIDIVGMGEGTYLSDGLSNLTFTLAKDSVSLTDEIYINGQKVDASVFGSMSGGYSFAGADHTVYSCDDEAGILLINVAPQANLPPIQYDRISTDPNKP